MRGHYWLLRWVRFGDRRGALIQLVCHRFLGVVILPSSVLSRRRWSRCRMSYALLIGGRATITGV